MALSKSREKSQTGLVGAVRTWFANLVAGTPETATLREAVGNTVDADDDQWRRLTGDGRRDLAPLTQDRMLRLAHYEWETNLLANRLIELPVAYLLSQGVAWVVADEDAQAALDAHWSDGLNNWDIKLPKRVRELALFGEQCYPVFRDANSGFVRLGYLDPALIGTVVMDPENREQPIGIVTKRNRKGVQRKYRVIVNVPETAFSAGTQAIRATFTDGECFFYRVNDLASTTRGRSDLLAQIDWLDAYDQFLFGELDRAGFLRSFLWDVTLTGASPEDVIARAKEITAPKPGSVRVHNENETWKAESPELQATDSGEGARLFRNHVLGGATIPEHWYGGAEDVNKSTGSSMTEPTEKVLEMRQQVLKHMLADIGKYVIRSHWDALDRELTPAEAEILASLHVDFPEMTAHDTTKYAAALQQVASAVAVLQPAGLVSRATALRVIASVAERLGVAIDVDAELTKALNEFAATGGGELAGIPLTVPVTGPLPPADAANG